MAWRNYKLKGNGISGNLFKLQTNFVKNRKHRIVLSGRCLSWVNVNAGVLKGYILGSFLFFIYINDLSDNLHCSPKVFADHIPLFSKIKIAETTTFDLISDFKEIKQLDFPMENELQRRHVNVCGRIHFSRKIIKTTRPQFFLQ